MGVRSDPRSRFGSASIGGDASRGLLASETEVAPLALNTKRLFDIVFSAAALAFFAPLIALIAVVLKWREGGDLFFAHERIGRGGRRFRCLKFRTMVPDAEAQLAALLARDPVARAEWEATRKLSHDPRITCFGDFLRRTSLDELPQFINVLRGDMSVVGPRPIVAEEMALYRDQIGVYLSIRPGITGLWQVSGRSDTTFDERVALDVSYAARPTLWRDIGIVLRTVGVLLSRKGAR